MKSLMLIASLVVALTSVDQASARPRRPIERTQTRQAARIAEGVKSGELNGPEARRLTRQQGRIENLRQEAAADGNISAREAARIRHKQHQANRRIYRQKHDAQQRGDVQPQLEEAPESVPESVQE